MDYAPLLPAEPAVNFTDSRGTLLSFRPETPEGFRQVLQSVNPRAGTIRGLHCSPYAKLIHVVAGSLEDFVVCLDKEAPDAWLPRRETLTIESGWRLVPAHSAHGFRTLEDNTTMVQITAGDQTPDLERSQYPICSATGWEMPSTTDLVSAKDMAAPILPRPDVLLLGATGFIGGHMRQTLQLQGRPQGNAQDFDLAGAPRFDVAACPYRLDTEMSRIQTMILAMRPRFVINAAGLTGRPNTLALESDIPLLRRVNYDAPVQMLEFCLAHDVPFVQVGSAMVQKEGVLSSDGETPLAHPETEPGDRTDLSQCLWRIALEKHFSRLEGTHAKALYLRQHLPQSSAGEWADRPSNMAAKVRGYPRIANILTSATNLDLLHPRLPRLLVELEHGDLPHVVQNFVNPDPTTLAAIGGVASTDPRVDSSPARPAVVLDTSRLWSSA